MPSSDTSLASLFSIKGKVALITGAGAGIGAATARVLGLAGGAAVAINDLPSTDRHHFLAEELRGAGVDALSVDADVSSAEAVMAMVSTVERELGPIDILVNNAGITLPRTIDETDLVAWERVLAIHLGGAFLVSQAVLPGMIARRAGTIIQMSSVTGHQGALRGHIAYATAKSGLLGFTKTLARTAGPHGVRVNAIAPGIVSTEMLMATHGEAGIAVIRESVPLGEVATPEDIASVALFLSSPAARHINGATIDVNGGLLMR